MTQRKQGYQIVCSNHAPTGVVVLHPVPIMVKIFLSILPQRAGCWPSLGNGGCLHHHYTGSISEKAYCVKAHSLVQQVHSHDVPLRFAGQ